MIDTIHRYDIQLDSNGIATFVTDKLLSYGIKAYNTYNDNHCVMYFTTETRNKTIEKLLIFWTGIRNEWWFNKHE